MGLPDSKGENSESCAVAPLVWGGNGRSPLRGCHQFKIPDLQTCLHLLLHSWDRKLQEQDMDSVMTINNKALMGPYGPIHENITHLWQTPQDFAWGVLRFICHAHISHGQQASSLWRNPSTREDKVQPGPASSGHAWSPRSKAVVDDWFSTWSSGWDSRQICNLHIRVCMKAELVQTFKVNRMYISQWPSFLLSHLYSLITPNNTHPLIILVKKSAGLPAGRMVCREHTDITIPFPPGSNAKDC